MSCKRRGGALSSKCVERDPLIGQVLGGRYRIVRVIGSGGMGIVYEAEHTIIEKCVAIKVLRDEFSHRHDILERFRQEAMSASRIGHPNIVEISDFGETPSGASFFVMELLDGFDLASLLNSEKTLSVQRAVPIIIQCCKALGAAHAKGIVHRDMKPENIFLTQREAFPDFVKIVDFGVARMSDLGPRSKLTKTGLVIGTPEYISPEQAAAKACDHRADVYALGVIMYEVFAGRPPFVGETFMAILTQHMFETPPPIYEVNPTSQLIPLLEAVIARAMSKDPDKRQQSMAELAAELTVALAQSPTPDPPVVRSTGPRKVTPRVDSSAEPGVSTAVEAPSRSLLTEVMVPRPAVATQVAAIDRLQDAARMAVIADAEKSERDSREALIAAVTQALEALHHALLARLARVPPVLKEDWRQQIGDRSRAERSQGSFYTWVRRADDQPSLLLLGEWTSPGTAVKPEPVAAELREVLGIPEGLEAEIVKAGYLRNAIAHRTSKEMLGELPQPLSTLNRIARRRIHWG